MFLAVMLVFLGCWLPWWIMFIIFPFQPFVAFDFEGDGGPWTPNNLITWLGGVGSIGQFLPT